MLALNTGAYIFLAVLIAIPFVIAFSYYTRRGSAINQRPTDSRGGAPGAEGPSHISTAEPEAERTVGTHGTR